MEVKTLYKELIFYIIIALLIWAASLWCSVYPMFSLEYFVSIIGFVLIVVATIFQYWRMLLPDEFENRKSRKKEVI